MAEVVAPPQSFTIVTGDLGEGSFDGADLEDLGDGIVSAGQGEDLARASGPTLARPNGVPLRMTADSDAIAASPSTPAIEAWRDGTAEVLSDDEQVQAAAVALDDAGALSAVLLLPPEGGGDGDTSSTAPGSQATTGPAPEIAGIGWGVEDGEARITIAYVFADDASAADAVAELERAFTEGTSTATGAPYSDLLEIEDVEAGGAVVVAQVRPGPDGVPATPYEMVLQQDLPGLPR